jgi:hypothetical protein
VLFSPVYIEAHSRRFVSPPPRDLCALCVSALDGFFSFVFSVLQLSTLNFQPPRILNSLPLNLFADPHPLTALASIFYKNNRGPGPHRSPLSPIFRTHFQVPYPVSPAVATLTKTAGMCTNNSYSGTRHSALTTLRNSFRFTLLRTLLRLRKTQLVCFHAISHSSPKTTRGGVSCLSIIDCQSKIPTLSGLSTSSRGSLHLPLPTGVLESEWKRHDA